MDDWQTSNIWGMLLAISMKLTHREFLFCETLLWSTLEQNGYRYGCFTSLFLVLVFSSAVEVWHYEMKSQLVTEQCDTTIFEKHVQSIARMLFKVSCRSYAIKGELRVIDRPVLTKPLHSSRKGGHIMPRHSRGASFRASRYLSTKIVTDSTTVVVAMQALLSLQNHKWQIDYCICQNPVMFLKLDNNIPTVATRSCYPPESLFPRTRSGPWRHCFTLTNSTAGISLEVRGPFWYCSWIPGKSCSLLEVLWMEDDTSTAQQTCGSEGIEVVRLASVQNEAPEALDI